MKTRIPRACFAGFLGTIIITSLVTFASPTLVGGPVDLAVMLARWMGGSWLAGIGMHVTVGTLLLPVLYVELLDRRLPGGPAVRGLQWGTALWLVSQLVLIPASGGGFFNAAHGGLRMFADPLVGHLAYGLVVGVFAGEPNERAFSVRHETPAKSELRRAA